MRRTVRTLLVAAGLLAVAFAATSSFHTPQVADAASARMNRQTFHDQMRTLWAGDHIVWTRCFIISAGTLPDNLPDIGPTTDRLLDNQTAIGDAFKPFYGADAGNHLTGLLRTHILTAAQLVFAAKAGDTAGVAAAKEAWYANAHDIAVFLHSLNPSNWSVEAVETLLDQHLDLTLDEAVARLQARYADDVAAYDEVHAQILVLADALSSGIIAQFPQKFVR
jgi:hypothetical protein